MIEETRLEDGEVETLNRGRLHNPLQGPQRIVESGCTDHIVAGIAAAESAIAHLLYQEMPHGMIE